MERVGHVYGLFDPRNGHLRYIGKTLQPLHDRVNQHLARIGPKTHKNAWLEQLKSLQLKPVYLSIVECVANDLDKLECEIIASLKEAGADLTNHTDGGDGGDTWSGRRHSPETRRRMSEVKLGKVFSNETRERMSESAKRRIRQPHSEETRAKIKESNIRTRKAKMDRTWQFFNKLIAKHGYESYLEIGCKGDTTFSQVEIANKVGVDPQRGGTLRMTSDEYFAEHARDAKFDLIFIDGLHESTQVLRDFENALLHLNPNGTIVLHDCDPPSEERQRVPPKEGQRGWCGDCWRAYVTLRSRPDVDAVCTTFDMGMGVVRLRANTDLIELPRLALDLSWDDLVANREKWLRLIATEDLLEWVG